MGALIDFITEILAWLVELVLWAPRQLYALLLEGLATVLEAFPVPAWLAAADPFGAIDPGVAYFADAFMIPEGIAILLSAYVLRFLVRRLPVVG